MAGVRGGDSQPTCVKVKHETMAVLKTVRLYDVDGFSGIPNFPVIIFA